MKLIFNILMALAIVYGAVCVHLYYNQRSMLFLPEMDRPVLVGDNLDNYTDIVIKTSDGLRLHSWYHLSDPNMPTILFLHGNAGDIASRTPQVLAYLQKGYGILLLEYRGYGGNPGKPTEQGWYLDGRAAMAMLKEYNIPAEKVILFGESLGTGVAVQLATEYPVKGVVLQSPFDSAVNVAKTMYPWVPVQYLMRDKFDSIDKIKKVKAPLLILHGNKDVTVPIRFGKNLFNAANEPKLWLEYPDSGHGDISNQQMQNDVLQFLQALQN